MIGEITTKVVLRFSPAVKERVLETRWHPSQESMDDPDKPGYLRWWVDVADTTDMKPWIRGWGANVEVIEPEELRDALTTEVSRLAVYYGVETKPLTHMLFWAKTGKDGQTHPLICHLIDVGQVALTTVE